MKKKTTLTQIINEEVDKILNEAAWPEGYFEIKNRFEIGGGAWRMDFAPGQLYNIVTKGRDQQLLKWNPIKQEWIARTPPISSNRSSGFFTLSQWNDWDANKWLDKFDQNSKRMSKGQAETAAKNMAAEVETTAGKGATMLAKLPKNQKVKIIFVK
jgi:hypothetical protein